MIIEKLLSIYQPVPIQDLLPLKIISCTDNPQAFANVSGVKLSYVNEKSFQVYKL